MRRKRKREGEEEREGKKKGGERAMGKGRERGLRR
jgi:hypothetical protein